MKKEIETKGSAVDNTERIICCDICEEEIHPDLILPNPKLHNEEDFCLNCLKQGKIHSFYSNFTSSKHEFNILMNPIYIRLAELLETNDI